MPHAVQATRVRVGPYAHLNLRINPFGRLDDGELADLAVIDLPPIEPGQAWQIIGDSGFGKSTHLLGLKRRYPGAIYEYPDPMRPRVRTSPRHTRMLLLDEAQRLKPRKLKRVMNRFETLVLGTHEDLRPSATRPLQTLHLGTVTPERLERLLAARVEFARLGPGPLPRIPATALVALLERHGDNVRAMEGELYIAIQAMEGVGDVQV